MVKMMIAMLKVVGQCWELLWALWFWFIDSDDMMMMMMMKEDEEN